MVPHLRIFHPTLLLLVLVLQLSSPFLKIIPAPPAMITAPQMLIHKSSPTPQLVMFLSVPSRSQQSRLRLATAQCSSKAPALLRANTRPQWTPVNLLRIIKVDPCTSNRRQGRNPRGVKTRNFTTSSMRSPLATVLLQTIRPLAPMIHHSRRPFQHQTLTTPRSLSPGLRPAATTSSTPPSTSPSTTPPREETMARGAL